MKIYKFLLVTVSSFLFFSSSSAFAQYGIEDVGDNIGQKTKNMGGEIEIKEFVLLDQTFDFELYYYPYSATDADVVMAEDVPGGAGSVFVSGGVIKWHANINTTLSIEDLEFTHIADDVTERNKILNTGNGIVISNSAVTGKDNVADLIFNYSHGSIVDDMSLDMQNAYAQRNENGQSVEFITDQGSTDFATKFYIAMKLDEDGDVQGPGTYRAIATVKASPTVGG